MKIKFFITFTLLFSVFYNVKAQDKWELRKNENGITIYSRREGKIIHLKLNTEFDCTPERLERELLNIEGYPNWVYGNKRSGIIKKVSNRNLIYFTEAHLPWPIKDRDLVIELTINPATGNNPLIIQAKSVDGYLPPKDHFIRVPYSLATWKAMPVPGNKIKLEYTFSLDPGGSIPGWLVNWTIAKGPYESFLKLGEILKSK